MGWDQHSSSTADAAPVALQDSHSYKPEEQTRSVFGLPGPAATTDPSNTTTKSHERWDPVMTSLLKQASNTHNTSHSPSFPGTFLDSCGPPPGIDQLRGQSTTTCSTRTTATTPVAPAAPAAAAQMDSSSTSTLGAPSSAGAASTRVGKKRSRASRRPPTTVLEADSASFRNMVQQLTGIPAPPPSSMVTRFDHFLGSGLVRPQAMRAFSSHGMGAMDSAAGAPGLSFFHQYQPPYSLRRLESQQQQQQQYRGMSAGFNLDPSKLMVNSSTAGQAVMQQQGGVYVAQGGNSDAWECEGEGLNAGVKREDGRPLPSWSTRL